MKTWGEINQNLIDMGWDEERRKIAADQFFRERLAPKINPFMHDQVRTTFMDSALTNQVRITDDPERGLVEERPYNSIIPDSLDLSNVVAPLSPAAALAIKATGDTSIPIPQSVRNIGDAFSEGVKESSSMIPFRRPDNLQFDSRGERIARMAGEIVGDLPVMAAGGALGALGGSSSGPGAVLTAAGGAFALPEAVKYLSRRAWEEGPIGGEDAETTTRQFSERFLGTLGEAGKGYAIGALTGLAGKLAPYGAKTAAELATMTGAGAALHGQSPTMDDVINNALLLGGMKGSLGAISRARQYSAERAMRRSDYSIPEKAQQILEQSRIDAENVRNMPQRGEPLKDFTPERIPDRIPERGITSDAVGKSFESLSPVREIAPYHIEAVNPKLMGNLNNLDRITYGHDVARVKPLYEMVTGKTPEIAKYANPEWGPSDAIVDHQIRNGRPSLPLLNSEVGVIIEAALKVENKPLSTVINRLRTGDKSQIVDVAAKQKMFETPVWSFEKLGGLKAILYKPWQYAQRAAIDETLKLRNTMSTLTKELYLNDFNFDRIGVFANAVQKDGLKTLLSQKKTVKMHGDILNKVKNKVPIEQILNPREKAMYDFMRNKYKEMYVRINEARILSGQKPFPEVENYFTFMRNIDLLSKEGMDPIRLRYVDKIKRIGDKRPDESSLDTFTNKLIENIGSSNFEGYLESPFLRTTTEAQMVKRHLRGTGDFQNYKDRKFGVRYPLEIHAKKVFEKYMEPAINHVMVSPVVAKARTLVNKIELPGKQEFQVHDTNPHLYDFITEWADTISGKAEPTPWLRLPSNVRNPFRRLSKNVAISTLSGSLQTVANQPAAIRNTLHAINPKWVAIGLEQSFFPSKINFAMENSNVLKGRVFDIFQNSFDDSIASRAGAARDTIGNYLLYGTKIVDLVTARASWLGAYEKCMSGAVRPELKGNKRASIEFADDVVVKTQGSAALGDLSRIQRNAAGKALTLFQTYAISDWNYFTHAVLKMGMPEAGTLKVIGSLAGFAAVTGIVNGIYEGFLGMDSPVAAPITAVVKESQKKDPNYFSAAALELASMVPILSGARFGSGPGGALFGLGNDIFDKVARPERGKDWYDLLSKAGGNPLYKLGQTITRPEETIPIGKFPSLFGEGRQAEIEKIRRKRAAEKAKENKPKMKIGKL